MTDKNSVKKEDENFNEKSTCENKQIICHGVDVSKCDRLNLNSAYGWDDPDMCSIPCCRNAPNCLFKQLARKTQECEKWKHQAELGSETTDRLSKQLEEKEQECEELKKYIQEKEVWGDQCEFCKHNDKENCHQNIILDNLKTINRYRKALEEIEEIVSKDYYDDTWADISIKIDKILDIINKAKGEKNEG